MNIPSGLIQLQSVPKELIDWINSGFDLKGCIEKQFAPIYLLSVQKNIRYDSLKYFMQNSERINAPYHSAVTDTNYPIVLRTTLGLYLFDGAHRANAALRVAIKLMAHYKDLTK